MRSVFRPTLLACLGLVFANARAESTASSDIFLNAFLACGRAEKLEGAGDAASALESYKQAVTLLDQISREDPAWKPDMVKHRREAATDAIARLEPPATKGSPRAPGKTVDQEKLTGPLPSIGEPIIIPGMDDFSQKKGPARKAPPAAAVNAPSGDKLLESAQAYLDKLKNDLEKTKGNLDQATREKEDLAKKLDKTSKDLADSAEKQLKLAKRADMAEAALLKAEKDDGAGSEAANQARAEIARLKKETRDLKYQRDAEAELREQLAHSIGSVQSRIAGAYSDRDAAKKANAAFPAKIAEMQKQIDIVLAEKGDLSTKLAKVQEQLNKVSTERDDAFQQLAKMKEASKNVDKLMSDNTTLMAKLTTAETQIRTFKAQGEEKDKQIAAMTMELGTVKQQLADAKKQSETYQAQMNGLQEKLDAQAKELTQVKSDAKLGEAERKRLAEENETLRGIVVRQMKEQALRQRTKQLVLTELAKLDINSKALLTQIESLGQPVVKLTEKEKKLFKQPLIEISDTEIAIAAPKESLAATNPPATDATVPMTDASPGKTPEVAKTPRADTKVPPEGELPAKTADGKTAPATNIPSGPAGNTPTKTPDGKSSSGTTADNMTAPESGSPAVPPELLSQAREAKDAFDKGNYRDAEKTYERILQKAPKNLYILSNLGVVLFRAQKLARAEEAFKKAIAIAPEDAFSRCTLGIVYYSEQKYDDAANELAKALAINPKNATAHNYIGITASQKGWQEAAQKSLETAVALDPQYADAHFNLAVVFATQQPPNKEQARKHYQLAISLGAEADPNLEQLIK